ncbi:MAG: UDP-2,3-diacylglucosamine diphosphatase LpxI [Candidatus Omnitrophota bacterium]|nr:UDP-2,3-diacylglucosamine diphosphatase LpxI [Candidatus Omnitrophota bacterium]
MDTIGLIAGNGRFPIIFARQSQKQGRKIVAVAIREEASPELAGYVDKIFWIGVGELKGLFDILVKEEVKEVVMAGQIKMARLFKGKAKPDKELSYMLKTIGTRQPYIIFREISNRLKKLGIKLLKSTTYLSDLLPERGIITVAKPTSSQLADIKFGRKIGKRIAHLKIGQTVVVKDKVALAIEGVEGTDEAIKRGGQLGSQETVIVKVSSPRQDMRFDVPVIGPNTIETMQMVKAKCLAIEAKRTLLIDKKELIDLANNSGISIVAF